MSLQNSNSDVEGVRNTVVLLRPDAHKATNVKLSKHALHRNSGQFMSRLRKSIRDRLALWRKRLANSWACITDFFVDGWAGEILAILLSIAAFMTIIALLCAYNHRRPPHWPHHLSLNFVVSTLATISKSALLLAVASALGQLKWLWVFSNQRRLQDLQVFDEASRGPLGALRLLISSRHLSWASIGAVITILCLIFDPFIQGLISVSQRVVYRDDPASLLNQLEDLPAADTEAFVEDYQLINLIDDAVFRQDPLPELQPHCPSGNCTFPPFTSLGFCSKCQDISQLLRDNSTYIDKPDCIDVLEIREPTTDQHCPIQRHYTYGLPQLNGQVLRSSNSWLRASDGSFVYRFDKRPAVGPSPAFLVIPLDWNITELFNFTDGTSIPTPALVTFIRISTNTPNLGAILEADLCALSLCAQKRNVSSIFNQASSAMLQTVFGTFNSSVGGSMDDFTWLSFAEGDFYMTFPLRLNGRDNALFAAAVWQSNLSELIDLLSGNMTLGESPSVTSNTIGGFNASSNISMTMDNIATALTNYYRASSNASISGQSGRVEIYIQVTWPWIALPAFLIVAGTFLLVIVIYESQICRARVWKTSELALLFHGLQERDLDLNQINKVSEMEHAASNIRTKMAKNSDGGWVLRRYGDSTKSSNDNGWTL